MSRYTFEQYITQVFNKYKLSLVLLGFWHYYHFDLFLPHTKNPSLSQK